MGLLELVETGVVERVLVEELPRVLHAVVDRADLIAAERVQRGDERVDVSLERLLLAALRCAHDDAERRVASQPLADPPHLDHALFAVGQQLTEFELEPELHRGPGRGHQRERRDDHQQPWALGLQVGKKRQPAGQASFGIYGWGLRLGGGHACLPCYHKANASPALRPTHTYGRCPTVPCGSSESAGAKGNTLA